jgi:hypothetical protein
MNLFKIANRVAADGQQDMQEQLDSIEKSEGSLTVEEWLKSEGSPTAADVTNVSNAADHCSSTTKFLFALAQWLRSVDDVEGQSIVEDFAHQFAAYEINIV